MSSCFRLIVAKHNPLRVLTVVMPSGIPTDEDGMPLTYVGCEVALQNRKMTQFGRANQRWYYDPSTGFVQAFHTDPVDKREYNTRWIIWNLLIDDTVKKSMDSD